MKTNKKGFTLVELLVVITIIGILAGLAIPGVTGVLDKARQMADVSNSKQVGLILFVIANDENGVYPRGPLQADGSPAITNSSEGSYVLFNSLILNGYLNNTKVLATNGSTLYSGAMNPPALVAANVGWDYVSGLTTTHSSRLPLLISFGVGSSLSSFLGTGNKAVSSTDGAWGDKGMVVFNLGQAAEFIKFRGATTSRSFPALADSADAPTPAPGYMKGGVAGP